jgi:chromosome segregation ATPase
MALFNKKEVEALQAENAKLNDKIILLEARLSARDTALREYRDMVEKLTAEVEGYKTKMTKNYASRQIKNLQQHYDHSIDKLQEEIVALKIRPHNERGAGRKHKATPEQRDYIVSLFSSGISQNKIARMMSEQTNDKWNKTTIRNIIISSKIK